MAQVLSEVVVVAHTKVSAFSFFAELLCELEFVPFVVNGPLLHRLREAANKRLWKHDVIDLLVRVGHQRFFGFFLELLLTQEI